MNSSKKSLTTNSIWYLAYNVLNVLFPLITGIYVARVLLPDNIGKVAYAQNIAQYFVILSFLGIPTYGLREIAKIRDDKDKLNRLFTELVVINSVSTVVFVIAYLVLVLAVPEYKSHFSLYGITGLMIALNMLNISWLYEGLEEFKFISIRNIVFKTVSFILLILFVKGPSDYLQYALITVIGTAGNYIINVIYAKRFARLKFENLNIRQHLKPIGFLVIVNLAIEIYTLVDITMIGNLCTDRDVAFYSYASKINKIFIQILNSFTMVIVPRLSWYIKEGTKNEFNTLLSKTLIVILILAIPLIVGIRFCGRYIVCTMYGDDYINSSYILQILSVSLVISPVGYLLGSRVMLVTGSESRMPICVGAGALVNIIGNAILISPFKGLGAAIASVLGELVVMSVYLWFSHKKFKLLDVKESFFKIIASTVVMAIYLKIITYLHFGDGFEFLIQVVGGGLLYFLMLILFKETIVHDYSTKFLRKVGCYKS